MNVGLPVLCSREDKSSMIEGKALALFDSKCNKS